MEVNKIKFNIMSNQTITIHDFEFQLICEYFSQVERQGTGSPEMTIKAASFIDSMTPDSKIADLGCGTGGQTMILAQNLPGNITGIDLFPKFIDIFNNNSKQLALEERVKGVTGSMDNLPFKEEELDLIWSEGAIYNIGFERGLKEWRKYLKKGGYIAVSEASWFTSERPSEIEAFWMNSYDQIDTIPNKVMQMQSAGYVPVATFIIPENCWTDHFYVPQSEAQRKFLEKYRGERKAEMLIEEMIFEEKMYNTYKEFYGYVFYIGKRI